MPLYFFGAQGADFCFLYPHLGGFSQNLGSLLHRRGSLGAFAVCRAFAAKDADAYAYSLGYITHYAADVTFHPYVYATAGQSPLRHTRVESALDAFFKRNAASDYAEYFRKKLTVAEKNELFYLYASIAAKIGFPPLVKRSFFRAISLYNVSSTALGGENPRLQAALINAERREWAYPQAPERKSRDGANELFEKSVRFALQAVISFTSSLKEKTPLQRSVFGKNYLSGL